MRRVLGVLRAFSRETRGAAAAEFAIWFVALIFPIMNVVDVSFYVYQKMEVQNAAQAAAQNAWAICKDATMWPATQKCGTSPQGSTLNAAILAGAHSTGLGVNVKVQPGLEGYYCTDAAGSPVLVGSSAPINIVNNVSSADGTPSKPSPFNCSSVVTGSTTQPGDYLRISVSYLYTPVFDAVSVTQLLPATMTADTWVRLG